VLTRAGAGPRPAACRPSTAWALSPRPRCHLSRAVVYEASAKGSRSSPARPSPHPWPPDDTGNPPAFPRAPHPRGQDPRTHAGAGTGSEHKPGTTPPALPHAGPPISEAHSQYVRLRVATGTRQCSATRPATLQDQDDNSPPAATFRHRHDNSPGLARQPSGTRQLTAACDPVHLRRTAGLAQLPGQQRQAAAILRHTRVDPS